MIIIFWTAANKEEAKKVASALVAHKLIACATIIPEVESIFSWKGVIEEAIEAKVILKTKKEKFSEVCNYIKKNVSYEVPEILMIPIEEGNKDYLDWIIQSTFP